MVTQPVRVLIVEDHKPLRQALARAARGWGAEVVEAGSIHEASAGLALHPDLVIVDVALPDGNARPIVEQAVRMRPAPAVIAMSGQASAEEAFELARIGARRHLAKPISLEDLTRAVEAALGDHPISRRSSPRTSGTHRCARCSTRCGASWSTRRWRASRAAAAARRAFSA
jgi:two-component system response regulator RegA